MLAGAGAKPGAPLIATMSGGRSNGTRREMVSGVGADGSSEPSAAAALTGSGRTAGGGSGTMMIRLNPSVVRNRGGAGGVGGAGASGVAGGGGSVIAGPTFGGSAPSPFHMSSMSAAGMSSRSRGANPASRQTPIVTRASVGGSNGSGSVPAVSHSASAVRTSRCSSSAGTAAPGPSAARSRPRAAGSIPAETARARLIFCRHVIPWSRYVRPSSSIDSVPVDASQSKRHTRPLMRTVSSCGSIAARSGIGHPSRYSSRRRVAVKA